ncbi:MAG: MerR family transcriptional regulator [Flavobacteriaceae bacterium]|nr:MerR family transcriptional regulator [Flavobacteriaceae bacterium]
MDTKNLIPVQQFCERYEIEFSFINSLNEFGLIEITYIKKNQFIALEKIQEIEKMIRLHHELGINLEGIDVIYNLLEKVSNLNTEINHLKNRIEFYED